MNLSEIKIKPISTQKDFEEASKLIDALVDADLLDDPEERQKALDFLEAITVLACEYEEQFHPIPRPTAV